jgi:prolipoprotein diacylglyceryltransferase
MFPFLSDLINYFLGTNIVLPFPMFGFMVAIAFIIAHQFFVLEMKRKEAEKLVFSFERDVIKGEKACIAELLSNGFFGFLIGFKLLEAILHYDAMAADPQGFMLSTQGNLLGGIIFAIILAYLRYREGEKQRLPEPKTVKETVHPYQLVGTMTFIAAIGGIVGAKLFDMIEDLPRLLENPIDVIFAGSGLSIYGGLIVGGGAVIYFAKKKGLNILHVIDASAPALILAYGIGRIGCQLSGDGDWGMPNDLPMPDAISFLPEWMWAFDYPNNVLGINLQQDFIQMGLESITGRAWPTPFYETIMAFIIFGILWVIRKKITAPGVMFSIYLAFNGLERFFIEFIRINPLYDVLGLTLSQAQIIAILFMVFGVAGIIFFNKKAKSVL